jgi:hypothetical protein
MGTKRLLKFSKLKKLTPAIRGEYTLWPLGLLSVPLTTDMPNIIDGDED